MKLRSCICTCLTQVTNNINFVSVNEQIKALRSDHSCCLQSFGISRTRKQEMTWILGTIGIHLIRLKQYDTVSSLMVECLGWRFGILKGPLDPHQCPLLDIWGGGSPCPSALASALAFMYILFFYIFSEKL